MPDREKLIELVNAAIDSRTGQELGERIADYLIAHGVTVRERGRWEIHQDSYGNELMWCRFCHSEFYDGDNDTVDQTPNFCPYCGADMR